METNLATVSRTDPRLRRPPSHLAGVGGELGEGAEARNNVKLLIQRIAGRSSQVETVSELESLRDLLQCRVNASSVRSPATPTSKPMNPTHDRRHMRVLHEPS